MKTITRNDDNVSIFATSDDTPITMQADKIIVGGSEDFIFGDRNSNNSTLHENVTLPEDYQIWKYKFDGTNWTKDSEFVNWAADGLTVEED
tara:strand:- start:1783 stop:2055 length:273 start_codon:yes stop_codon:yes gene_type:complete